MSALKKKYGFSFLKESLCVVEAKKIDVIKSANPDFKDLYYVL